jgi:glutamate-ammonia-ligase adenylyltransferase
MLETSRIHLMDSNAITTRMGTWERLALLKAWPVAGSWTLGRRFLEMSRPFIFNPAFDLEALADVREMKARLDEKIQRADRRIETSSWEPAAFVNRTSRPVIQAMHGARMPEILDRNTLRSLVALRGQSLLSDGSLHAPDRRVPLPARRGEQAADGG